MALLDHTQLHDVGTGGQAHSWEAADQTAKTSQWRTIINRLTSYLQHSELAAAQEADELESHPSL
jgi:hypothetical protein